MQVLILPNGEPRFIGNLFDEAAIPDRSQWTRTDAIFFGKANSYLGDIAESGLNAVGEGLADYLFGNSECEYYPTPGTDAYMREASLNFIASQISSQCH